MYIGISSPTDYQTEYSEIHGKLSNPDTPCTEEIVSISNVRLEKLSPLVISGGA